MLHLVYPFLVILWFVISLILNKWTASRQRHYSTQLQLDALIPFVPGFAALYFSAYVLGNMGYFILYDNQQFSRIFIGYVLLFIAGTLCYITFPCRVNRNENLRVSNLSTYLLAAFQQTSKPYNSFPSMHVGYSLFSSLTVLYWGGVGLGIVLLVWAGLVAISTLLTKQHHLLDVVAGAALASVIFWSIQLYTSNG